MNCIIVDDNEIALKAMEQCLRQANYVKHSVSFTDPVAAISHLAEHETDLILLDVEMPGISGIEFIKALRPPRPIIILSTSHRDYAIDAFDNNVTDFLIKPVSVSRFMQAMAKAKDIYDRKNIHQGDEKTIFIKKGNSFTRINIDEILWVESLGDYVVLNTSSEKITVHSTMQAIEEKLGTQKFIRVHRSYLIQTDKITDIEDDVISYFNQLIPIGKTYRREVYSRFKII